MRGWTRTEVIFLNQTKYQTKAMIQITGITRYVKVSKKATCLDTIFSSANRISISRGWPCVLTRDYKLCQIDMMYCTRRPSQHCYICLINQNWMGRNRRNKPITHVYLINRWHTRLKGSMNLYHWNRVREIHIIRQANVEDSTEDNNQKTKKDDTLNAFCSEPVQYLRWMNDILIPALLLIV